MPGDAAGHGRPGDLFGFPDDADRDGEVDVLYLAGQRPVRAGNPVHGCDQQSCPASRPAVMITNHVPAVRLLLDRAGVLMASAVPA
jgi:hypothetical protein